MIINKISNQKIVVENNNDNVCVCVLGGETMQQAFNRLELGRLGGTNFFAGLLFQQTQKLIGLLSSGMSAAHSNE